MSASMAACMLFVSCGKNESGPGDRDDTPKHSGDKPKAAAAPGSVQLPDKVTFNAHIQPVLSEKCYHCHGPDSGTREPKKAPLRIDREQFAFEKRENGKPVIVRGKPAESLLVELLKSEDRDTVMPPPESHKTMSAHEIALVEKWIAQGAEYEEHWAFIAPSKPVVPVTRTKELEHWATNPIDQFTLAKMEENGLEPNPEQAPRRLLRRIYFDITGLPPTPEATEAFVTAHAANPTKAVNDVLDHLFKSPAYGEQQGRLWLDAARYADTHGIHIDNYREIWPYRDWVVDAFNRNMPFDQFTIEQLGGDLLPNPSLDQKVATGFNRCLPTTGEGGSIAEEVNAMYATDRVNTTFGVWQGLTVGCAECHDHKFDPVSQKEFYQISAYFRNTTMAALDRNDGRHPPSIYVAPRGARSRMDAITREVETLQKTLAARKKEQDAAREADYQAWLTQLVKNKPPGVDQPVPGQEVYLPLVNPANDLLTGTANGQPVSLHAAVKTLPGVFGHALQIGDRPSVEIGDFGNFKNNPGFSYGGFIYVDGTPNGAVLARMDPADKHRGWDLWLQSGHVAAHVIEQWPTQAVKAFTQSPLAPRQWHHVMVVYDPSRKKDSLTVYLNGKPAPLTYSHNHPGQNIQTRVPLRLGSRAGNDSLLRGVVAAQDLRVVSRPLKEKEVQDLAYQCLVTALHHSPESKLPRTALRHQFDARFPAKPLTGQSRIAELTREREALAKRGSYSLIMEEKPKSQAFAHILERGNYASKGEKVFPGVPSVLSGKDTKVPPNRLGLAQWLVNPENPLTARVTVNRYWHYMFGRGIVETTEDFGIMGSRPSHPQLLDWLATEFVESGWDVQHMLRLMVTSSTYRQSAVLTDDKKQTDPKNILFARSSRFRLHGEQLRDLVLSASGLLVDELGGPPVKPYQPDGIWSAVAMKESNTRNYQRDTGEKLYRRSIYTIWKRTAPHPSMELLNAPPRETFCVRRELTNTPLAALVTMNDVQFVEAVRVLATKAIKATADDAGRLDYITLRLMSRELDTGEKAIAADTLGHAREKFKATPEEAAKLVAVGDSPVDPSIPPAELAAWTLIASQILNLDETLTH